MTDRPITRRQLLQLVRSLGYDPGRVSRVTIWPDRVVVDLVTETDRGTVERTEIRRVDG